MVDGSAIFLEESRYGSDYLRYHQKHAVYLNAIEDAIRG